MKAISTGINGVLVLSLEIFCDKRGFFFEAFNQRTFNTILGTPTTFVQDNQSRSRRNVLRGLHYQVQKPQGKLVRAISGEIFDVVVDIRKHSPSFGKYMAVYLSAKNKLMVWVPPGFAHGFLATSDNAEVLYKTTDYWAPEFERCIIWNDHDLNIQWPILEKPILSDKDSLGERFVEMKSQ